MVSARLYSQRNKFSRFMSYNLIFFFLFSFIQGKLTSDLGKEFYCLKILLSYVKAMGITRNMKSLCLTLLEEWVG